MSSEMEDPVKSPPPGITPEAETADDRMGHIARSRLDVYPPNLVRRNNPKGQVGGDVAYIGANADREFMNMLTKAGVPPGAAQLFLQLLWKVGDDLRWGVSASTLAKAVGRSRTSVSRGLAEFERWGIARKVVPREYPTKWQFPIYETIEKRLEKQFPSKIQRDSDDVLSGEQT